MKFVILLARLLFAFIFIYSGVNHLMGEGITYAEDNGVPIANLFVPAAGAVALLGGLSILLGFKAKWGAWFIVLFLVGVTFTMHHWWTITEPMARQMQLANFNKNLALLGGALYIAYFGAGALSIDAGISLKRMWDKIYREHKLQHI